MRQLVTESWAQGYTVFPGLVIPEAVGVGAPVFGADGTAVAALSIASIEQRMTEMRHGHIVDRLLREAKSLSDDLLKLNPRFNQGDIRRLLIVEGG